MTIGKRIVAARKQREMSQAELAAKVGLTGASLSVYENDGLKGGPDRETLIRISKALGDSSLLSAYCDNCSIRGEIFIRKFPTLNNIETNPMVIASKVMQELQEGIEALKPLQSRMMTKDFPSCPDYQQVLELALIQIIGTARSLEILKEQYMVQQILSPEKLREIIRRQQEICEIHGHHKPGKEA